MAFEDLTEAQFYHVTKAQKPKCLVPFCERDGFIRGLCRRCWRTADELVLEGFTTWARLEATRKVLKAKVGRRTGNDLIDRYREWDSERRKKWFLKNFKNNEMLVDHYLLNEKL